MEKKPPSDGRTISMAAPTRFRGFVGFTAMLVSKLLPSVLQSVLTLGAMDRAVEQMASGPTAVPAGAAGSAFAAPPNATVPTSPTTIIDARILSTATPVA